MIFAYVVAKLVANALTVKSPARSAFESRICPLFGSKVDTYLNKTLAGPIVIDFRVVVETNRDN